MVLGHSKTLRFKLKKKIAKQFCMMIFFMRFIYCCWWCNRYFIFQNEYESKLLKSANTTYINSDGNHICCNFNGNIFANLKSKRSFFFYTTVNEMNLSQVNLKLLLGHILVGCPYEVPIQHILKPLHTR